MHGERKQQIQQIRLAFGFFTVYNKKSCYPKGVGIYRIAFDQRLIYLPITICQLNSGQFHFESCLQQQAYI